MPRVRPHGADSGCSSEACRGIKCMFTLHAQDEARKKVEEATQKEQDAIAAAAVAAAAQDAAAAAAQAAVQVVFNAVRA